MRKRLRMGLGTSVAVMIAMVAHEPLGSTPGPKSITLRPLGVFQTGLYDEGAVEIAAYDPTSRQAFMTLAERPVIRIVDLSNPGLPVEIEPAIDLRPWGDDARATSVAVHDGLVAAAVPRGEDDTAPGLVLFFEAQTSEFLAEVTVGALPDMVTFSPNGNLVLTANEGQPNDDYTVDPEGSVSIIDVRRGVGQLTQDDVTTVGFGGLTREGLDPSVRIIRAGATVAQDLEPEYIAMSHDSTLAWVTLQENNALAIIDLRSRQLLGVRGLGFKDHAQPGAGLDGSRDDGANQILTWPVLGMYQPDGIAAFRVKGDTYLITANEGDVREYAGLNAPNTAEPDVEAVEIEDIALDANAFPDAAVLQSRVDGIGRLKVSAFEGDTDGDGDYDRLYTFGARSFSIHRADGTRLFDSGDALERITRDAFPAYFNASHTNNRRDDRSDDKGPEPEGVTVAHLFGRPYAFIMLERIGGVVVYELSDPLQPRFVQYINMRDFTASPGSAAAGDLGPEAARVIPAELSPNGRPLLMVSNEVSGSLRLFEIRPTR